MSDPNWLQEWEYDLVQDVDMADERSWLVGVMYPPTPELRPRVLLQQMEVAGGATGMIWCYPEDLARVIAKLSEALAGFREQDAKRENVRPRPLWGLGEAADELDPDGGKTR